MEQSVKFLAIGTFVGMPAMTDFGYEAGQTFEIISHYIEVNQFGLSTLTTMIAVNPTTAEDIGKEPIKVNLDMWDYSVI